MASLCASYSVCSFVFHPSEVLPSHFMAPPSYWGQKIPQQSCVLPCHSSGVQLWWHSEAKCLWCSWGCRLSPQDEQAMPPGCWGGGCSLGCPWKQIVTWIGESSWTPFLGFLNPAGWEPSAATSVQTVCADSSGAGGLFLVPEMCPQLSHRGVRASHLLWPGLFHVPSLHPLGRPSHLSCRKVLFPSPVCAWAHPSLPTSLELCSVQSGAASSRSGLCGQRAQPAQYSMQTMTLRRHSLWGEYGGDTNQLCLWFHTDLSFSLIPNVFHRAPSWSLKEGRKHILQLSLNIFSFIISSPRLILFVWFVFLL